MTEMEELKKNTDQALATQRLDSIIEWITQVENRWEVLLFEAGKNLKWMLVVVAIQLILTFLFDNFLFILCFIVLLFLIEKQNGINRDIEHQKGLLVGTHKTLFLLGLTETDIEDGLNKRKKRKIVVSSSPFKRFKELFERLGSKDKKEAHA